MDRNNILAFALSMLVFAAYLMYQAERREAEPVGGIASVAEQVSEQPAVAPGTIGLPSTTDTGSQTRSPAESPESGASAGTPAMIAREIPIVVHTLETAEVRARISNGPQMIEGWELLHYDERLPGGAIPIDLVDPNQPILSTGIGGIAGGFADVRFEVVHAGPREILQRAQNEAGTLTRTLRLDPAGYGFDLELAFDSHLPTAIDARFEIGWPARASTRADFREVSLLAYGANEGVTRSLVNGVGQPGFLGFGGSSDGKERVAGRSGPASTSPISRA